MRVVRKEMVRLVRLVSFTVETRTHEKKKGVRTPVNTRYVRVCTETTDQLPKLTESTASAARLLDNSVVSFRNVGFANCPNCPRLPRCPLCRPSHVRPQARAQDVTRAFPVLARRQTVTTGDHA